MPRMKNAEYRTSDWQLFIVPIYSTSTGICSPRWDHKDCNIPESVFQEMQLNQVKYSSFMGSYQNVHDKVISVLRKAVEEASVKTPVIAIRLMVGHKAQRDLKENSLIDLDLSKFASEKGMFDNGPSHYGFDLNWICYTQTTSPGEDAKRTYSEIYIRNKKVNENWEYLDRHYFLQTFGVTRLNEKEFYIVPFTSDLYDFLENAKDQILVMLKQLMLFFGPDEEKFLQSTLSSQLFLNQGSEETVHGKKN